MVVEAKPEKNAPEQNAAGSSASDQLMEELTVHNQEESIHLSGFFANLSLLLFHYCKGVGLFCRRFGKNVKKDYTSFYHKHLKKHTHRLNLFWLRVVKRFSKLYKYFFYKLYSFLKFFLDAGTVIKNGYQDRGLSGAMAAFAKGTRNNGHVFVTALNYVMPLVAVCVFAGLIIYVKDLDFAVSVSYNGENVGYIQDETVFEEAEARLQERLLYQEGDEVIDSIPQFTVAVVDKTQLQTGAELTNTIIKSSDANIVEATGIKVDGKFYGAVKNGQVLEAALADMLDQYRTSEDSRVDFMKQVDIETGLYLQSNIKEESELVSLLTSSTQDDAYYTTVAGDSPSLIAEKNNMKLDELVAMNPNILSKCMIGQQVKVQKSQPFLPIKSTVTKTYNVEIPFETTYTTSASLYEGQSSVVKEGEKGIQSVTADIEYVDGVEVGRTVLSQSITKMPVDKQVAKGTKKMVVASNFSGAKASDYGFIDPVYGGYVSQGFSGYHNGIDIAFRGNGYGKPIYSVLPGTVTFSGWRGSYGNLVIVNHGNGIETWYAHCSKLTVSAGQTVAQGTQIANVGSTGRSSGNHVHFRVLINGAQKNPRTYLPGY